MVRTIDREPGATRPLKFLVTSQISDNLSRTHDGYLVCHDVAIARTGQMLYHEKELNGPGNPRLTGDAAGIVRIEREPDEVFRPETMASFEGKPITMDHPTVDVGPANWTRMAKGVVTNVRQGTGDHADSLMADLLVMDKATIDAVLSGKREVSCGYDADYQPTGVGRGRQKSIVGNHVAIVPRGRCGAKCSIRDGESPMKISLLDGIRQAFKAKTEDELEGIAAMIDLPAAGGSIGAPGVTINLGGAQPLAVRDSEKKPEDEDEKDKAMKAKDAQIADLTAQLTAATAARTTDGDLVIQNAAARTTDAAHGYTDFLARAEILAPGVKAWRPTADAAADPDKFRDGMCICKRRALDAGLAVTTNESTIRPLLGGRTIDALSCDAVDAAFIGASELIRAHNNGKVTPAVKTADAAIGNGFFKDAVYQPGGIDAINAKAFGRLRGTDHMAAE